MVRLAVLLVGCLAPTGLVRAQETAEALLNRALDQYAQGQFEASVRSLQRADKLPADKSLHAKIWLYLGVNRAVLNDAAGARQAFTEALRTDSSLELDEERFKPSVVRLFREEKAKLPKVAPKPEPPPGPKPEPASAPVSLEPPGPPRPPLLRPGTRRWFAAVSLGGSLAMNGGTHSTDGNNLFLGFPHQFTAWQEVGLHFARHSSGAGLSFVLTESVGPFTFSGFYGGYPVEASFSTVVVEPGFRFLWDIPLGNRGLYLCPSLRVAYAYLHAAACSGTACLDTVTTQSAQAVSVEPGLELKLLLGDRGLLFFRPLAVEVLSFFASNLNGATLDTVTVRYGLHLGGGVTF
jgi:hypothetical protein